MLAVRLHDKKEICFSFIIHTMEEVAFGKSDESGRSVKILRLIRDYNKHMGGVDKNDVLVGNNSCARKSQEWTRKVFFLFIEEAVLFILQRKRGSNKCFLQFKLNLIRSILRETHIDFDITEAGKIKYVGRHYIEWINHRNDVQYVQKMEDEEIVDIIAKYLQTTLAYVLPHVSENIIKNKTEGGTEH